MPITKGRLNPRDEQRIQRNYDYLMKEVNAQEVAPALFEKGVLEKHEKNDIMNETKELKRNRHLLDLILESGPGNSFKLFLEVLEEKYGHVVKRLRTHQYDWFEEVAGEIKTHVLTLQDAQRIAIFFTQNWEKTMESFGFTETYINQCKEENSGSEDQAKVVLLQTWVSPGNRTVAGFMECVIQAVDSPPETCPTIDWEGLKRCITSEIDVDEMDFL